MKKDIQRLLLLPLFIIYLIGREVKRNKAIEILFVIITMITIIILAIIKIRSGHDIFIIY